MVITLFSDSREALNLHSSSIASPPFRSQFLSQERRAPGGDALLR